MKLKVLSLLIAASGMSHAALYTLTNGSSATANGIANSAGLAFQNSANASFGGPGVTAFGIFSTETFTGLTGAQIIASFTPWSSTGSFIAPGAFGSRGTFTNAAGASNVGAAGTFTNKFMYAFIGNATSFATSTEFLILKTTFQFLEADDSNPNPIVKTINTSNSSVLFGSTATDIRTTTADASVTAGWKTVAPVPEPSAALLGAIGALGLLRRRRF